MPSFVIKICWLLYSIQFCQSTIKELFSCSPPDSGKIFCASLSLQPASSNISHWATVSCGHAFLLLKSLGKMNIPEILLNFYRLHHDGSVAIIFSHQTHLMSNASICQNCWILFHSPPRHLYHLGLICPDSKYMFAMLCFYLCNCFYEDLEAIIYSFLHCSRIFNVVRKTHISIMNTVGNN